jgi:hypothetical protein
LNWLIYWSNLNVNIISNLIFSDCFIAQNELQFSLRLAPLYCFLTGEAKLESYLEQNPPFEKNVAKARIGLIEPKNCLLEAITEEGDKVIFEIC